MKKIIEQLSNITGQPVHVILTGKERTSEFVEVRQMLCWLLKQNKYSERQIASLTGYNRCTVFHSIKRIQSLVDVKDEKIINIIEILK